MPIFRNNERGTVSGRSKVSVKRGRLGSGSYWPKGVPIAGNVFGPNTDQILPNNPPPAVPFGTPGNNANFTRADQGRLGGTTFPHPNAGFNRTTLQNKVPAITRDGDGIYRNPFGHNPVIQPHEKNSLPHRKIFGVYRTVSGVSNTLPVDTAFHRVPPKERPKPIVHPQVSIPAVMSSRERPSSFVSRNHLWSDPNQSYLAGRVSPVNGEIGRGRWSTTKKGAAG
jgi:hypothetical protein